MKKNTARKKFISMGLAFIMCLVQIIPTQGSFLGNNSKKAKAASPQEVGAITASGAALLVDPLLTMPLVEVDYETTNFYSIKWNAVSGATGYYIYRYNDITEQYEYIDHITDTYYEFNKVAAGEEWYVTICAVNEMTAKRSNFSFPVQAYTRPDRVDTFSFAENAKNKITLKWNDVESATGYIIYRAAQGEDFVQVGTTSNLQFTDTGLKAGTTYQYKIRSFSIVQENYGEDSDILSMTTIPASPTVKIKGGDEKVRLSWSAINGADGYTVYQYQNSQYIPIIVLSGNESVEHIQTELTNGETYQYQVTAYKTFQGINYEGAASKEVKVTTEEVASTSTEPKLFKTKKQFKKSEAYKKCKTIKKKAIYNKSFAMPGMINTNVAGFKCTSMIPQGLTIAEDYMLMAAYDSQKVENSVIYVMNKKNGKLLTTIVLPNKPHVGGIAYDGSNIWITQNKSLRSFKFSEIQTAIEKGVSYYVIAEYDSVQSLDHKAGSVVYYYDLLWVASYNELSNGQMVSYQINSKESSPVLVYCESIKMPSKVQGIEFTENGRLLVSRSCQTDSTKRGFFHRIDVYKPNLEFVDDGEISLGKVRNSIDMPTMNEEIAIDGKYVYINYESVSFGSAVKQMDRICAFPLSYMTKLKKK